MEVSRRLRSVTRKDAINNYNELKALECNNIGKRSRVGLNASDYFLLRHRIKAKTKRHISFFEALKDDEIMDYIDSKIKKIKKLSISSLTDDEHLRQRYSVFQ